MEVQLPSGLREADLAEVDPMAGLQHEAADRGPAEFSEGGLASYGTPRCKRLLPCVGGPATGGGPALGPPSRGGGPDGPEGGPPGKRARGRPLGGGCLSSAALEAFGDGLGAPGGPRGGGTPATCQAYCLYRRVGQSPLGGPRGGGELIGTALATASSSTAAAGGLGRRQASKCRADYRMTETRSSQSAS